MSKSGTPLAVTLSSKGYYFAYGSKAYKGLPAMWFGQCSIASLFPNLWKNNTLGAQHVLKLGTFCHQVMWSKQSCNPLIDRQSGFHAFTRDFLPMLGVPEVEKTVVNISAELALVIVCRSIWLSHSHIARSTGFRHSHSTSRRCLRPHWWTMLLLWKQNRTPWAEFSDSKRCSLRAPWCLYWPAFWLG